MKIAVSSQGPDLASRVDPRFGRAIYFIVYDLDTDDYVALPNAENADAAQGAGILTAQSIARQNVDLVVSGNVGPKAFAALRAAGVKMVAWDKGTVVEAVQYVRSGEFKSLGDANVQGHWQSGTA